MATKPVDGKFSLPYFFLGEGKKDWLRTLGDDSRRLIIYGVIFLVIFFIYNMFFKKAGPANLNKPTGYQSVFLTPGSKVETITQDYNSVSTQKSEQERKWWIPHLYTSVSAGVRSKAGTDYKDFETEIRAEALGLRWDWN